MEDVEEGADDIHVRVTAVLRPDGGAGGDACVLKDPDTPQHQHHKVGSHQQVEEQLKDADAGCEGARSGGVQVVPVPEAGHDRGDQSKQQERRHQAPTQEQVDDDGVRVVRAVVEPHYTCTCRVQPLIYRTLQITSVYQATAN